MSEIHMRNVPFACDHHTLKRKLAEVHHHPPYLYLTVTPANFHIRLFNKRSGNGHSGSGSLTLPTVVAEEFMENYADGEDYDAPQEFWIMGRRVEFKWSHNSPSPDVVEMITRLEYKDPKAIEEKERKARILSEGEVHVSAVQFGWECRDKTFSIEWEHREMPTSWEREAPGKINTYFSDEDRELRVKFFMEPEPEDEPYVDPYADRELGEIDDQSVPSVEIVIRFPLIQQLNLHTTSDGENVAFLTLMTPPRFELYKPNSLKYKRLTHLPFPEHDRVVPFTSLHLRLILLGYDQLVEFQRLAKVADLSSRMSLKPFPAERRDLFSVWKIDQFYELWVRKVPWAVAFQAEGLVRSLVVSMDEMIKLMPAIRRMLQDKGSDYTVGFLKTFRNRVRVWWQPDVAGAEETDVKDLAGCWKDAMGSHERTYTRAPTVTQQDPNLFDCLHVTVTPTSMALEGPFPEQSNRVIRSYSKEKHECFLRVSFADEDRLGFRFNRYVDGHAFIKLRVGGILHNGLEIAGRRFIFLAYSQSALKDHAVWFIKKFDYADPSSGDTISVDAPSIINSLGTFPESTRRCPARYAARLSQAFTATESAAVEVEEILIHDDHEVSVLDEDGEETNYIFTDGIGQLSLELANDIWMKLRSTRKKLGRSKGQPRAFQIRFEGSKGMLAVNYKLKGATIALRDSMIKFEAPPQNVIEIARAFDRPSSYFLNRPLIMILEGLGVPYGVFEKLQDAAIEKVQKARQEARGASGLMETFGLGASYRLSSLLGSISRLGIDQVAGDDFYDRVLAFTVNHILRDIKNKARIPVPKAWTLVGVIDEHNFLKEGEIYACVKPLDSNSYHFFEGPVLVSRSPTIHPGDVQVVHAVGRPPLGSAFAVEPLPNTIVFSMRGARPLPSCLGGGDLDGDLYNLVPLNDLPGFRPRKLYTPAAYPPAPKRILDRDSTMADVSDFVVEYIVSDNLGMIATEWLRIADQTMVIAEQDEQRGLRPGLSGIFHPDCIKLSELHSNAVDFQKSGEPVSMSRIPKPPFRNRPDWNAPETVNVDQSPDFYPSKRAIGRLFRRVDLGDINPHLEQERQVPRLRRAQSLAPEDLIMDAISQASGSASRDDPVLSAIEQRVQRFLNDGSNPEPDEAEDIAQMYHHYVNELQAICATHVLAHRRQTMLTEEEAVVGTIIEKTSQRHKRNEMIAKLRERTDYIVRNVRGQLDAEGEEDLQAALRRAWIAWNLALRENDAFGAKSFGWVALGSIFDTIKDIEHLEKEEELRRHGRHSR